MQESITGYVRRLKSLKEFVAFVAPALTDRRLLIDQQMDEILRVLYMVQLCNQTDEELEKSTDPERFKKFAPFRERALETLNGRQIGAAFELNGVKTPETQAFESTLIDQLSVLAETMNDNMTDIPTKERHLYESSLTSLITIVDWFLGQIFRAHVDAYPVSLGGKEKLFAVQDILAFASIEEARKYVVDLKIDALLRLSFDDLWKQLAEDLKYDLQAVQDIFPALSEAYQRRNLLVHNDGIVNGIYLQRVAQTFRQKVQEGKKLSVRRDYLDSLIDDFEVCFVIVAHETWIKTRPSEITLIGESIYKLAYGYLLEKRYSIVVRLANFASKQKKLPEEDRIYCEVNCWLARKYSGDRDAVIREAAAADYSAKTPRFRLARLAVMEDRYQFYKFAPEGLRDISAPGYALSKWPLFEPFREDAEFKKLLDEHPNDPDQPATDQSAE
jgi:hypothetical protein